MSNKNSALSNLLYNTNSSLINISLLLARLTVGGLLFIHGAGKVLGWFHGHGMDATVEGFAKMGFAAPLTYLSMFTEFLGGIMLVLGIFTRPVSVAVMINMLVATIMTLPHPFLGAGGAQTPFIFLMVDILVLINGPGIFSIDRLLFGKSAGNTEV